MEETGRFCECTLPIRMERKAAEKFKVWYCSRCKKEVNPKSKMISKFIEKLDLKDPTRNEIILMNKVNEILELMGAKGDFIG